MKYLIRYWLYLFFEAKFPSWLVQVVRFISKLIVFVCGFPKETIRAVDFYADAGDFKSVFRLWLFMLSFRFKRLRGKDAFFPFFESLDSALAEQWYAFFSLKESCTELDVWMAGLAEAVLFSGLKKGGERHYPVDDIWYRRYLKHKESAISNIKALIHNNPVSFKGVSRNEKRIPSLVKKYLDKKQRQNFSNIAYLSGMAEKAGLKLFPVAGTLLGLIREGALLSHDIDSDLGCFWDEKSFQKFLLILEENSSFQVKKYHHRVYKSVVANQVTYEKEEVPILVKIYCEKGTHIDIFIFIRAAEEYSMGSSLHSWVYRPFKLNEKVIDGFRLYLPEDPDSFLTQTYGTWKIEKKEFSYHTDTPNMRNAGTVMAEIYNLRLALKLASLDSAAADKVITSIDRPKSFERV